MVLYSISTRYKICDQKIHELFDVRVAAQRKRGK